MIIESTTYICTRCQSSNIHKNGHNQSSTAQFRCKDCGRSSVLKAKIKYTEQQKELIINAYLERGSLRGMQRLFCIAPETLTGWIKKIKNRKLSDELLNTSSTDVLELDELWSFVKARRQKVWTWIALCRRTRQVVAYVCGQRNDETCTDLRCCIPTEYFNLSTCSDHWSSYADVFNPDTHRSVGKYRFNQSC